MPQNNITGYNTAENSDDLVINPKKLSKTLWSRRKLILSIFLGILTFFILLTFILPKKYRVTADLYINKSNSSNMAEVNPYMFDDSGSALAGVVGVDKAINNEMQLIKSELVLDKVIKQNNITHKKLFGIIPNKKYGELKSAEEFYNKGKVLKIDSIPSTNVVTLAYTAKDPELAYGVINSLITNYIELHKEINIEKSKADKKILEAEYARAKADLNRKLNHSGGLPAQSMAGIGNLSAMSAFSSSASKAISNIKSQYVAGEKSQIAVNEESQKVAQLASKLEWANMVEQMSEASKVLVIKEPKHLRAFENSSPKLFMNIILGIMFGFLVSTIALIWIEIKSSRLTYLMLTNNIIFDAADKLDTIKTEIYSLMPQKVLMLSLLDLPAVKTKFFKGLPNLDIEYYSNDDTAFLDAINDADKVVLLSKIDVTDAASYKLVRKILTNKHKEILYDILM